MSTGESGQKQVLDWQRLNFHTVLWHLGFYLEYMGLKRLSLGIYRSLSLLGGNSQSALRYRTMAAAKLVPFGMVDKRSLEMSPGYQLLKNIRQSHQDISRLNRLRQSIISSPESLRSLWSLADMSEILNERSASREIYNFLRFIEPNDPDSITYVSLSFYRLGQTEESLRILDEGIINFPDSKILRDNKLSLGLATGNIRAFLSLPVDEKLVLKDLDLVLHEAAVFISKSALAEFAMRLPGFCSQEPVLANRLIEKVCEQVRGKFFVFPFIEYVLGTMVRSGVTDDLIHEFRKVLEFKALTKKDRARKNRILDVTTKANFSYDLKFNPNLSAVWSELDKLSTAKIKLRNPLSDIPSWTPWVGAFVQAPRTPLWKTITRILPLVRASWPIVDYIAPHTLSVKSDLERIKIGFLFHSSMPMISGLLRFFPKTEFETFFIYPKDEAQSGEGPKWMQLADSTIEISARDLKSQILDISKLGLDILISGPSTSSLWFVFLARLARIQAILIEPAWTDGSANLDYYISWKPGEPFSYADSYQSSVAFLDSPPYWIEFSDSNRIETVAEKLGVLQRLPKWSDDQRIYLCASTLIKLNPEMDEVIEGILTNDLNSRIVFFRGEHLGGDALKARLRARLGENFSRLIFLNTLPSQEAHALLQSVHCVFDSFPLNGMSSSFDGLKLGVPIVTLESDISFGKWTSGIYKYIGVEGLTASSKGEFIAKCLELATSPKVREVYSREILLNIHKILSTQSSALEFVTFIKSAWDRYKSGGAPADWIGADWAPRNREKP